MFFCGRKSSGCPFRVAVTVAPERLAALILATLDPKRAVVLRDRDRFGMGGDPLAGLRGATEGRGIEPGPNGDRQTSPDKIETYNGHNTLIVLLIF